MDMVQEIGASLSGAPAVAAADIMRAGQLTVYELFRATVLQDASALAIEAGERQISRGALDDRVRRLARLLRQHGVGRGDRVAVLSENRVEYVECMLAAAFIGAVIACQNWRLAPIELRHCIQLVTPVLILVSPRHASSLRAAGIGQTEVVEFGDVFERRLAACEREEALLPVDAEDGLLVIYTSGTTGMPKGALISHRAEIARMTVLRLDLSVTREDGFVAWAPMFHMGSADQVLGALMSGAPVIVVDGFDCGVIVDAMVRHLLGWLLLMPGTIEPVMDMVLARGIVPRGIKAAGAMPDLVPRKLIAAFSGALNAPYLNSFGSTETGLPPASGGLFPPGIVPESLSKRASSLCRIRLLDLAGEDVNPGEPGDVAVRGPTLFSGYWNAAETNARDFRDGWFRTGDLFRRNADGSFDFVDRAKYMIKSGGENIYPAEIERVLLADPRITDAVVVRRADDVWGEVPVAFVSTIPAGPGEHALTSQAVEAICRESLASFKRPKEVRFVAFDDFPRSTTGKIQRHEVEKWL
jgi:acyl-CoA synthetase (AMP-forming)/AMP-acid ligase II